ncbi:hypothetical protein B0T17DRAFT_129095 [Bombardia bombarda]|uniref:Uncharacterized protein n=1 Tax=Bombardia bombarda TaxID=252184 RepID=A0AA39TQS6_9PEZI|nr:hypothetical protein B0T17DRAFT_129095 [Bombardia bombarda]
MADNHPSGFSTVNLSIPTIKTFHKKPYPAISPLRPELSQAGRTVLLTGSTGGIGFAIARAFVQAQAARVIITSRRASAAASAQAALTAFAKSINSPTVAIGTTSDVSDLAQSEQLWAKLASDNIYVDVLVLNAAYFGASATILKSPLAATWNAYEVNVRTLIDTTKRFYEQPGGQEGRKKKYVVNVSTSAIHNFYTEATTMPLYGASKNAGTLAMQQIAKDIDVKDLQIVSYHPGGVFTQATRDAGYTEDMIPFDHEDLPGNWGVWAASEEAAFLHGRFVVVHWDIDDLKKEETRKLIAADPHFLQIGVVGVDSI